MNQNCVDNASLSSLETNLRARSVEASNILRYESTFSPSGCEFPYNEASHTYQNEQCFTSGTGSFENIDSSHDCIDGNDIEGGYPLQNSHTMIQPVLQPLYQTSLSHPLSGTEMTTWQSGFLSNPTSELENETVGAVTCRRRAHQIAEKRYRENIDLKFLQLGEVLSPDHHSQDNTKMAPHQMFKRMNRAAILEHAHDDILTLRAEIKSIKGKLESLREATFPDTYKFTLRDD
ncbi:hypothetical protein PEBR_05530 [Penicillium brasilianum]|uniref:BHLH domain-containing protein n=1 Tax=Penicillium brasilianum TaxID=104259 RepID=A0A1S9RXI2_PENBI|nr:hypothetical protein PEBR_05530 [Penicillium brasilianum]